MFKVMCNGEFFYVSESKLQEVRRDLPRYETGNGLDYRAIKRAVVQGAEKAYEVEREPEFDRGMFQQPPFNGTVPYIDFDAMEERVLRKPVYRGGGISFFGDPWQQD